MKSGKIPSAHKKYANLLGGTIKKLASKCKCKIFTRCLCDFNIFNAITRTPQQLQLTHTRSQQVFKHFSVQLQNCQKRASKQKHFRKTHVTQTNARTIRVL